MSRPRHISEVLKEIFPDAHIPSPDDTGEETATEVEQNQEEDQ